jgi:hypothetical protein
MKWTSWLLAPTAVILLSATAATPVRADDRDDTNQANRYEVTKLTSNISGQAENTDPVYDPACATRSCIAPAINRGYTRSGRSGWRWEAS